MPPSDDGESGEFVIETDLGERLSWRCKGLMLQTSFFQMLLDPSSTGSTAGFRRRIMKSATLMTCMAPFFLFRGGGLGWAAAWSWLGMVIAAWCSGVFSIYEWLCEGGKVIISRLPPAFAG